MGILSVTKLTIKQPAAQYKAYGQAIKKDFYCLADAQAAKKEFKKTKAKYYIVIEKMQLGVLKVSYNMYYSNKIIKSEI